MKIQPLGRRVLVRLLDSEERMTSGGIALPNGAKDEKTAQGTVMATGSAETIEVRKGDVVLFQRFAGTEFEQDQETFVIIKMCDILAIVEA